MVFQVACSSRQAALITSLGFITLEMDNQRRYLSWNLTLYVMFFVCCLHFGLPFNNIVEPNIKCNLDLSIALSNASVNRKAKHTTTKKKAYIKQ